MQPRAQTLALHRQLLVVCLRVLQSRIDIPIRHVALAVSAKYKRLLPTDLWPRDLVRPSAWRVSLEEPPEMQINSMLLPVGRRHKTHTKVIITPWMQTTQVFYFLDICIYIYIYTYIYEVKYIYIYIYMLAEIAQLHHSPCNKCGRYGVKCVVFQSDLKTGYCFLCTCTKNLESPLYYN